MTAIKTNQSLLAFDNRPSASFLTFLPRNHLAIQSTSQPPNTSKPTKSIMGDAISTPFKKPEPLTILCFGDSLTAGYSKFGLIMAPYSRVLKTELEVMFWARKDKRKIEVTTDGQSGDLVTVGSFKQRMSAKCWFVFACSLGLGLLMECGLK
jgi:lysophospholipase L1-like esterase